MPRTVRTSSRSTTKIKTDTAFTLDANKRREVENYLKEFDVNYDMKLKEIRRDRKTLLSHLEEMKKNCKALIAPHIGNTTIENLAKVLAESNHYSTLYDSSSYNKIKTAKKKNRSLADDEGYLTAENSENSRSSRKSGLKAKGSNAERPSKSLSKHQLPHPSSSINDFKTPATKKNKNDFGFVTPKIIPNTPQVVLRRPKEGEMALSMQGSPLLVNPIVSREANVNIPLADGRTISILPQYGLRQSQMPMMDSPARRQIEILRDNLIKMCEFSM